MRRVFVFLCSVSMAVGCVVTPAAAQGGGTAAPGAYVADFDTLWTTMRDGYAYLDGKGVDWNRVREVYRPQAAAATSVRELIPVLERTLDELYDAHTHLKANTAHSWRLVPSGADLWAEWEGDRAVITQVRPGYSAELAGLREGMAVTAVNGVPIAQAVEARMGQVVAHARPQARQWALLSVLAGMHDTPRVLRVRGSDGGERDVRLDQPGQPKVDDGPQGGGVEWRRLDGRLGYVRLTDLSGDDVVPMFDAVLDSLRTSRGLILDLRETAAGGTTS
ncbi:MAG TPA: hypothetical protein VFH27_00610, partial [Longimicrobiaceae bacterium]|nr:hypothetical protein [Longimicrobiaceae bacterium]